MSHILLADMNSFYASVEIAHNPSLAGKPVLVCGDPERRHGIILASSREAKARGVKTAMTVGEALALCPQAVTVRPRMALYLETSWKIQQIARSLSPAVEVYSVDELFIDTRGTEKHWGSSVDTARLFQRRVQQEVGVPSSVGISHNKFLAKMACGVEAKKSPGGVALWRPEDIEGKLHPLPIGAMHMVGRRMERNFQAMGILTIGDLAHYPPALLKKRWGAMGEVYHYLAWGRDGTSVCADSLEKMKGLGHNITLPRDYIRAGDIEIVLLELTDEVCRRARRHHMAGRTVSVSLRSYDLIHGFHRQASLAHPTNLSALVYEQALLLFRRHWDQNPVRTVGVHLSQLTDDSCQQQQAFFDVDKAHRLSTAVDAIRDRYGSASLLRACSLTSAGMAHDRANKIGGHYAR